MKALGRLLKRAAARLSPYGEPAGPDRWRALHALQYYLAFAAGNVLLWSVLVLLAALPDIDRLKLGAGPWIGGGIVVAMLVFGAVVTWTAVRHMKVIIGVDGDRLRVEWWYGTVEQKLTPDSVRLGRRSWMGGKTATVLYFQDRDGWLGCVVPFVAGDELYTMVNPPRPALQLAAGTFGDLGARSAAARALIERLTPFIAVKAVEVDCGAAERSRSWLTASKAEPGPRPAAVYTIALRLGGLAAWERGAAVGYPLGSLAMMFTSLALTDSPMSSVVFFALAFWTLLALAVIFWVAPRWRREQEGAWLYLTESTITFARAGGERELTTCARFDRLISTRLFHSPTPQDIQMATRWPGLLLGFPDGVQVSVGGEVMRPSEAWFRLPTTDGAPTYVVGDVEWQLLCDRVLGANQG